MYNLDIWKEKIKNHIKETSTIDAIKDLTSWCPLVIYNRDTNLTVYKDKDRSQNLINEENYDVFDHGIERNYSGDLFNDIK